MNKVERVYVVSKSGQPLMPTKRLGKVRRLLKSGKAKVFRYEPFTIQLLYETTEYTQEVTLGVDAGYQTVGFSATTKTEELKLRAKTPIWHVRTPFRVCHALHRNNWRTQPCTAHHVLITGNGRITGPIYSTQVWQSDQTG